MAGENGRRGICKKRSVIYTKRIMKVVKEIFEEENENEPSEVNQKKRE